MRFSFEFALISICLRPPVEDCPSADGEDEKFERERDEKTIALNLTKVGSDFPYKKVLKTTTNSHLTLELGGSEAKEGHSGDKDVIFSIDFYQSG